MNRYIDWDEFVRTFGPATYKAKSTVKSSQTRRLESEGKTNLENFDENWCVTNCHNFTLRLTQQYLYQPG